MSRPSAGSRRRVLALSVLLACGKAQASEWVSLTADQQGQRTYFVDVTSIKVAEDIRHVWSKMIFVPQSERGVGDNSNKWVTEKLTYWAFNCHNETFRFEASTIYYADSTNDSGLIPDFPWTPVTPDTVTSTLMQFVCSWKPK